MKKNPLAFAVGMILLLVFGLLLFVFQVRQSEVAVKTTFGKMSGDGALGPGLHFKWPWPIQKVHKLDQRIQNFEGKFEQTQTPDGFTLLAMVYAGWRIGDPAVFFPKFEGGSVARAEEALEAAVRSAKNEVIGQHPFSHLISTDEKQLKFTEMELEILRKVQAQVAGYGMEIKFLGFKKIGLPESVTQNVFERMRSERDVLISKIQFAGEEEATKIRSTADRESAKLLSEAEGQATRIRAEGESAAAQSFEVFKQDPELANLLFKLAGLELFLREKTTLILDQQTSPLDLFNATGVPKK